MRLSTPCAFVLATGAVATPTPPTPRGIFQALPAGATDGAYRGTLKPDGSTQWEFLGDADSVSEGSQLPRGFSKPTRRGWQGRDNENSSNSLLHVSDLVKRGWQGNDEADSSTSAHHLSDATKRGWQGHDEDGSTAGAHQLSDPTKRGSQGHDDGTSTSEASRFSAPSKSGWQGQDKGDPNTDASEASGHVKRWQGQAAAGPFCTRRDINADDVDRAIDQFGGLCGAGHTFTSVLAIQSGSAIAYGCFYGSGETTCYNNANSGPGLIRRAVDYCGRGRSAWYSLPSGQVSYGVNNFNQPFC